MSAWLTVMVGPGWSILSGWSCSTTYAVISLVRLATGTGCSGPDATSTPMDGTATAACPIVGHGSVMGWVGTCPVRTTTGTTAGAGSGVFSRTPTNTPAATTTTRSA